MADGFARRPDDSPNLEQLRYLLNGIFNAPSVGLAVFDTEARVVMSNPAFAYMVADSLPPTFIGKTVRQIMGDSGEGLELAIRQIWGPGQTDTRIEVSRRSTQHSHVSHWHFNLIPARDDTSGQARVIAIAIETNHEKSVEAYLLSLMADMNWIRDQIAKDPTSLQERRETVLPITEKISLLNVVSAKAQSVSVLLRSGAIIPPHWLPAVDGHQLEPVMRRQRRGARPEANEEQPLSPREQEVLRLVASDKVCKEIASMLGITAKSVATLKSRIMLKLHLHSTTALVIYAIRHKMVSLDAAPDESDPL